MARKPLNNEVSLSCGGGEYCFGAAVRWKQVRCANTCFSFPWFLLYVVLLCSFFHFCGRLASGLRCLFLCVSPFFCGCCVVSVLFGFVLLSCYILKQLTFTFLCKLYPICTLHHPSHYFLLLCVSLEPIPPFSLSLSLSLLSLSLSKRTSPSRNELLISRTGVCVVACLCIVWGAQSWGKYGLGLRVYQSTNPWLSPLSLVVGALLVAVCIVTSLMMPFMWCVCLCLLLLGWDETVAIVKVWICAFFPAMSCLHG